jgi:integrase
MRTRGRPVWAIKYKGLDGRWHRERTDATTKEQAARVLAQRLGELSEAKLRGAASTAGLEPITLEEFVTKEYLPHCQATHTSETYHSDKSLAALLLRQFGKMLLRGITAGDVQRYLDRCVLEVVGKNEEGEEIRRRPATINRRRMFLSGVFSEAIRRGYLDRNPARGIPNLPEHNDRLRWLTKNEEERILGYSPDYLKPILLTALKTGMRKGELLRLKWADLDFDQRILRVAHTKNHKVRYIPMNRSLVELLGAISPFVGPRGQSPYVFTNAETGGRYKDLSRVTEKICRKAGLDDVTFHTLRHTFASRQAQAGIPLNTIRELLGHGDMKVTMRYAHLAPNNLREAVEALEDGTRVVQTGAATRAAK